MPYLKDELTTHIFCHEKKGEIDRFVLRRAEKVSLQGQGKTNQDKGLFISLSDNQQRTYFAVSTCPFTSQFVLIPLCPSQDPLCPPTCSRSPSQRGAFSKIAATLLGNPSGLWVGGNKNWSVMYFYWIRSLRFETLPFSPYCCRSKDNISMRETHIYITMETYQDALERSCRKVKLRLRVCLTTLLLNRSWFNACFTAACLHTSALIQKNF